jgi:hypothetical protein
LYIDTVTEWHDNKQASKQTNNMEKSEIMIQKVKTKQSLGIKLTVTVKIVRICGLLQWVACLSASVRHTHNELNLSRYFRRVFSTVDFLSVCYFNDSEWLRAFLKEVTKNTWS